MHPYVHSCMHAYIRTYLLNVFRCLASRLLAYDSRPMPPVSRCWLRRSHIQWKVYSPNQVYVLESTFCVSQTEAALRVDSGKRTTFKISSGIWLGTIPACLGLSLFLLAHEISESCDSQALHPLSIVSHHYHRRRHLHHTQTRQGTGVLGVMAIETCHGSNGELELNIRGVKGKYSHRNPEPQH